MGPERGPFSAGFGALLPWLVFDETQSLTAISGEVEFHFFKLLTCKADNSCEGSGIPKAPFQGVATFAPLDSPGNKPGDGANKAMVIIPPFGSNQQVQMIAGIGVFIDSDPVSPGVLINNLPDFSLKCRSVESKHSLCPG